MPIDVELEAEYSPSSRVGGSAAPFVAEYVQHSMQARAALAGRVVDLPGGSLLVEATAGAPLLIFIHGGYWAALSAEDSLYLAPGALCAGWSFAAVEYTLAPKAGLPRMIAECRGALASIASAAVASSIVVTGHSAGAHLAAMTTLVEKPSVEVTRTVLVSGVFDIRPLVHTTVNDPLRLDEAAAAALSPALLPTAQGSVPEVVLAWGDNDTTAFAEQSRAYAAKLATAGKVVTMRECRGRHHFDVVADLVDPTSELGELTMGGL